MPSKVTRVMLLSILTLITLCNTEKSLSAQSNRTARVSEETIRTIAIKIVMPAYPEESRRRGTTGVVVAELLIDDKGEVANAEVLEAPDRLIAEAVITAVKQWRFKPARARDEPVNLRGKLTFYYVAEKGRFRVQNPS